MATLKTVSETTIARLPLLERIDVGLVELARPALETPLVRKIGELGRAGDDRLLLFFSAAITVAGFVTRNGKLQRTGFRMLATQLVAKGAKELGKNSVDRTRPSKQIEEGRYVAKPGTSRNEALRSFPSGHTASALAVARAFSREYPRYTKPVLTAAAVVGALQVPRRANYPGDVAAGAGAGLFAEKLADGVIAGVERLKGHASAFAR
ncbi:MAG TPA: phosphatase PAP2 family protein [Sphingobium sp.]